MARAGPFGNVINHLVFSPDDSWLEATTAGVGLKMIDGQAWRVVAEDAAVDLDVIMSIEGVADRALRRLLARCSSSKTKTPTLAEQLARTLRIRTGSTEPLNRER